MNKIIFIILLPTSFLTQNLIKDGVYNLIYDNHYLYYSKRKILLFNSLKHPNTYFRITYNYKHLNDPYYNIEELLTKYKMSYLNNKTLFITKNNKKNNNTLWSFIKINNNNYFIKNKNNCYIKINRFNIICDNISPLEATHFNLIKIFEEVKEKKTDNELIEKEPIDALIKYIDLKDPLLDRGGIHQIEKDYDNEELKYSIRSILKNIPWIRKIFILMPNEKVSFFKDYKFIKDKIIYVKDKDILGYDSSNSLAFQYRYWKLERFGISNNFIVMDDDYFIGNKLEKKDFFYVENGKVVPAIITSRFLKIDGISSQINCDYYRERAYMSKEEQNDDIFFYSKFLTYLFIINTFNKTMEESIFIPRFTHNAIPVNTNELKEIYNIIYNSKYKKTTLDCLYRHIENIQFQTFVLSYTFIKYNKKIINIPYKYIKLNDSIISNYNYSLFCINRGAFNYSEISLYKAKIVMDYLFPIPTPYEIIDYSISNLSFNVIHSMETLIELNDENLKKMYKTCILQRIIIINMLLIFLKINIYKNNYKTYELINKDG